MQISNFNLNKAVALLAAMMFGGFAVAAPGDTGDRSKKSADQIVWETRVGSRAIKNPAFAYVRDNPDLPRVLLIGDSISIGYTPVVRKELDGKANVHRIPMNGGDTSRGIEKLDEWLGSKRWDVIHFNWGLHDLKYMKDGHLDMSGSQVASTEQYGRNLELLVKRLKATGARLIWASTTPVPKGSKGRVKGDEKKYNAVAAGIMKKNDIPIDDLYGYMIDKVGIYQNPANVHYNKAGYEYLGKKVAADIMRELTRATADNAK